MKKTNKPKYSVYFIQVAGVLRYIGYTSNIKRREYTHNYLLKKGTDKKLYNIIREKYPNMTIELQVIDEFDSKTRAKQFEALIILYDSFNEGQLWQTIPRLSDV